VSIEISIKKVTEAEYSQATNNKPISFLQKPSWGQFKSKIGGYSPEYYLIYPTTASSTTTEAEGIEAIGGFMALVKRKIRYVPRATLAFDSQNLQDERYLTEILRQIKALSPLTILEVDYPHWLENFMEAKLWKEKLILIAKKVGAKFNTETIQPKSTIVKTTVVENLMESFPSSDTRRNCRRGLKRLAESRVKFVAKTKLSEEELAEAAKLVAALGEAKEFSTRDISYFRTMQETLPGMIWWLFTDDSKIVLANAGVIDTATSTYYDLYVGRDRQYDKMYISFLLKYYSFEQLKSQGIKYYDHWGVFLDPKSPKYGFSVFKLHFGGRVIDYPPQFILGNALLTRGFKLVRGLIQ
jgi:lipid II:glycine glycyltransferase (peptidoglycan interpeptide bridge formation enzyme)